MSTNNTINSSINYPNPTGVESAPDFFFVYLNNASGGVWGLTLVGLSFGIPFMALMNYNAREAFAAASFNGLVCTIILAVFGVVGSFLYALFTVMIALAVILNRGENV